MKACSLGLALAAVGAGLGLTACGGRAAEPDAPRNVVVVLADTLRADHVSLYGYPRKTTPNLDRRAARQGVVFENVRAQAPCTFPSVNSMLTSRSPLLFLRQAAEQDFAIPEAVPSLATLLAAAGYATAAVSASPVVRDTPSKENPRGGYGRGFRIFDEACYWGHAECVTARALEALAELPEPFFLYAHYLDPHDPYVPRHDGGARFAGAGPAGEDKEHLRRGDLRPIAARMYEEKLGPGLADSELAHLVDLYDDEIRYWDEHLVPLFRELARSGRAGRTVVAVVSDHGENFLEHGHVSHCRTLFDTELQVPFVLFVPGVPARRVVAPVSNLDLVPTLLDLVEVPHGTASFEGRSLATPLLRRRALGGGEVFQRAWWSGQRGVSDGRHKLIAGPRGSSLALYDLELDPGERTDVAASDRETLARLRRALAAWLREQPDPGGMSDDEVEKQLRALGYLQ